MDGMCGLGGGLGVGGMGVCVVDWAGVVREGWDEPPRSCLIEN